VIYLPDIEPGLTIKVLRHLARKVAITVPDSERYFRRGQTVVTGYPLRAGVVAAVDRRDEAVAHFRLDPARQTLLVWGGSLGSRAINIGVISILPQLLADGVQIIHVTGATDRDRAAQQVAELGLIEGLDRYRAFEYLHEDMALALAAADLTICRAGASTLGEFTLFGLPSILIPLAYSWRYQQINAEYLASRGAAVHLPEERMATDLLPAVRAILNDPARRSAMRETAQSLARPDGALNVARVVAQVAGVMA
jgi:UDP-N-acetylglucosamine--N-acetylmuramyl-(pentapeptide) pyrophosphoryl-undecaprenol N-acetylglucosamine transferase